MKFYLHYKNKPYKYVGLARHSETQEELVLYETRYENNGGKLWVRPKDMFFESVQVDEKTVPRFKQIPLQIVQKTTIDESDIQMIAPIIKQAFGEWDPKWFYSKFQNHTQYHLLIGLIQDQPVGFKLGYKHDDYEFYSWLGGVIPEYRGLGIASDLMKAQHEWCRTQGYKKIQTKTQNRFRDMFVLNLKHGFNVIGTQNSDEGGLKIIMEKSLIFADD